MFRGTHLLILGLGTQLVIGGLISTPPLVVVLSMALIAAFLFLNRARSGFPLALAGLALNGIVIALNGAMPVSAPAMQVVGTAELPPGDLRHALATGDTVLPWLGDVIRVGERLVSIGDILMLGGLVWFLAATARSLLRTVSYDEQPK